MPADMQFTYKAVYVSVCSGLNHYSLFCCISCSDIYCAQLFEDLTNTVRDSTFVSVELEGLTTIADTIQTQIKGESLKA